MADTTYKKYNPNRSSDWNYGGSNWKLSRSKIDLFVECPRCFYLDNKLGTARPRGPAFTLNVAVDELFKKEFDHYRTAKKPHPIMKEHKISAVPFAHKELDSWRENFVGIIHTDQATGFVVSGAVDDIWEHEDGSLIVVDYKSTSKEGTITSLDDSGWKEQYERQIGVYQWLLAQNGFTVHPIGYFVYANALKTAEEFGNTLTFETTLVPCQGKTDWIAPTLSAIKACLDSSELPTSSSTCEYCAYREASGKKLQKIYFAHAKK